MKSLTLIFVMAVTPAAAQQIQACGARQAFVDYLSRQYQEVVAFQGLSKRGWLIEVFVDKAGGSWSILTTSSKGFTCIHLGGTLHIVRGTSARQSLDGQDRARDHSSGQTLRIRGNLQGGLVSAGSQACRRHPSRPPRFRPFPFRPER